MDVNSKLMLQAKRKISTEDDKPRKKSRKCSDNYLDFGFTFVLQNGEEKPQCVICNKILASESMLPNKLKRHLTSSHPQLKSKPRSLSARKLNDMKRQVSTISKFTQLPSKALLASYQVAHRIAKCKKPHSIGEELILPAAIDLATTMIGEGAAEKLKLAPLSNDTVCRRIGDMALDIHDQLIDQMKQREFGLQLDEATDGSRDAHLICYVRFVDFSLHSLVEELLLCKPIEIGCRGIDLFNIIDNFISTNNLDWENCISICTDSARAMSGSRSGLRSLIQERAPMAKWVHCMIHREALVARELSPELGAAVEIVTKVINFIKTRPLKSRIFEKLCADMNAEHRSLLFYCSSRWLSLGKSFERVYGLLDELRAFLQQEKNQLADYLSETEFLLKLANVCDIFDKLNKLNLSMQGAHKNVLDISNKITAFTKKLSLWKEDIAHVSGGSQYFPILSNQLQKKSMILPSDIRSVFVQHLSKLELKFAHYFQEDLSSYEWIQDPYAQPIPSSLTEKEKENYIDLTCDSFLKRKFNSVNLTNFCISLNDEYPALTKKALRILVPFATSYLCEAGFSAMAVIKTKYRSRIDVEREMRVAVSKILPRFHDLCKNKQAHTSH